ncbi:MAG: C25 family cysteine peptidase, partial [Candidatus Eisenbacteria bacterium]
MRRTQVSIVCLVLVQLFLVGVGTTRADVSTFTYDVPEPRLKTLEEGVYYAIDGFGSSTTPYYPVLPTRKVNFEIPFAATNVEVSVMPGARQPLGVFSDYLMRKPPLLLGDPDYVPPAAPERIPDLIPARTYRYMGERILRGHRVVEIVLSPLQYTSGQGAIEFVSSYAIDVTYSMPVTMQASENMAFRERSGSFEPLAAQIIENYDQANDPLMGSPPGPLYDLDDPQYAIITTSAFQTQAETLAAWKTKKGVPTGVYMLSWIESTYSGYDTQEKIRNFLRLDSSTPRFDYVLLLGDSNIIPTRLCDSEDGDQVPCDYYYSDVVDGAIGASYDWDTDNDHVYGEYLIDTITWLPDTYVGRIASRSATEVETIVNNIISYEKTPPTGSWPKRAVFGAAFANYPEPGYDPTDMAAVAEWVQNDFLNSAGVAYERLYEAGGIYPTSYAYDYPVTATNFETRVGVGCGFAFPSGHGNYLGNYRLLWAWDDGDGYYDDGEGQWEDLATQSYNPPTGGEKPYVLVGACLAGEFDRTSPCFGDYVVANWGIGAVASSRTSYYCVGWDDPDWPWNQGQEYRWWEEIFSNGKTRMGQIHGDQKYHYTMDFSTLWSGDYGPDTDYASRKNMFSSNLFGDPELPVWTDSPTSISVVHSSTLPTGSSPFAVTVTSGAPLEGATVCLWKDAEVYMVDQTNASGIASFTPDPTTTGTMYVTVTKHNHIPYEGSATVETGGDTQDPVVTVTEPNGGETWAIDSFFDITWSATDNVGVTSVDILLSTDGGGTYPYTIAAAEPNDGVYPWLVDVSLTTEARVKVIAYDAAMNSGQDESDGDFEIADGTDPNVTVTEPNGGETWAIDSFFDITWSASDNVGVTTVDILLSSDGGATYPHTIATGETNDGVFAWQVDASATTEARVKVMAYDAAGNDGEDASDADFTVADGTDPVVTVTQPNGGETWAIDSFFDITWSASDNVGVTTVDILLSS